MFRTALFSVSRWRRLITAFAAACLGVGGALAACGGSTGHEDLPPSASSSADATLSEAGVDEGGAPDGTLSDDGNFDAGIQYADPGRLAAALEAAAAVAVPEGGSVEAAPPPPWASWPGCNQDTAAGVHEVPDDSGVCPTFQWTTTFDSGIAVQNNCNKPVQTEAGLRPRTCDECIRCNGCGVYPMLKGNGVFPPCSDLPREGGALASQGPGAGIPLYDLCAALFVCVSTSGCTGNGSQDPNATVANCYCGTAMGSDCLAAGLANGACKAAIEAAVQAGPSVSPSDIVDGFNNENPPSELPESHTAADDIVLYQCALTGACDMCFP